MFSAADAYERFMGRWSRALAPLMVPFAGIRDGETVLDVGCGTGGLTAAIARAAAATSIVGVDPSAAYVAFAQARHKTRRVRFDVADARQLPFQDACFDRTVSLLMLDFVPDRDRAVREFTTTLASFDDYWRPFLEKQGPAGAYVATLSDPERERLRSRLQVRLFGDAPDRPIALSARARAVRGTVAAERRQAR